MGDLETVLQFEDRASLFTEAYVHDGTITMIVQTHAGDFSDWRVWTIKSTDNAHTWSEPEPFELLPRRTFIWNRCVTSWGEWVLPFQTYDTMEDPIPAPHKDGSFKRAESGALVSSDEGRTWQLSNRVGPTSGWAENNIVELSDGRLVMFIRADGTGCLSRSESTDRARIWSAPMPTDIPNPGTRFRLYRLSGGRIALLHNPNSRTSHPNSKRQCQVARNPLALWISDDDMQTWAYQRILTNFPGMLAYPDGVVDENEKYVHFTFDYNRHDVIYIGAKLPEVRKP